MLKLSLSGTLFFTPCSSTQSLLFFLQKPPSSSESEGATDSSAKGLAVPDCGGAAKPADVSQRQPLQLRPRLNPSKVVAINVDAWESSRSGTVAQIVDFKKEIDKVELLFLAI